MVPLRSHSSRRVSQCSVPSSSPVPYCFLSRKNVYKNVTLTKRPSVSNPHSTVSFSLSQKLRDNFVHAARTQHSCILAAITTNGEALLFGPSKNATTGEWTEVSAGRSPARLASFLFSRSFFVQLPVRNLWIPDSSCLTSQTHLPRTTAQIADLTSGLVRELAPDRKSRLSSFCLSFSFSPAKEEKKRRDGGVTQRPERPRSHAIN